MDGRELQPDIMETNPDNCNFIQNNNNNNFNHGPEFKRKRKKKMFYKDKEKQKQSLVTSGTQFIRVFQKQLQNAKASKEETLHYMQRVLHSIFFFGHINHPQIKPEEFIPTDKLETYKRVFQNSFKEYNTHFPRQAPYSILLEYMTKVNNTGNPESLMEKLVELNKSLRTLNEEGEQVVANYFDFSASVVTQSYIKDPNNANILECFYGASLSCKGETQRKIMIYISALYVWDKAISYVVSCGDTGHGIVFPEDVHCKAYRFTTEINGYKEIPPCVKCHKMFITNFDPEYEVVKKLQPWRYGNCAETESLSKLLQGSLEVRNHLHTFGDNRQPMSREDIEKTFTAKHEGSMREKLANCLASRDFRVAPCDWKFFTPGT
ncbi:uncharacterized protein [Hyperolius riggenbachi]|uniref:uncharacterized protein n=1 Tax=Hyperolius riggenbachi TaxID=752182 RepID=UPI0035A2D4BF